MYIVIDVWTFNLLWHFHSIWYYNVQNLSLTVLVFGSSSLANGGELCVSSPAMQGLFKMRSNAFMHPQLLCENYELCVFIGIQINYRCSDYTQKSDVRDGWPVPEDYESGVGVELIVYFTLE